MSKSTTINVEGQHPDESPVSVFMYWGKAQYCESPVTRASHGQQEMRADDRNDIAAYNSGDPANGLTSNAPTLRRCNMAAQTTSPMSDHGLDRAPAEHAEEELTIRDRNLERYVEEGEIPVASDCNMHNDCHERIRSRCMFDAQFDYMLDPDNRESLRLMIKLRRACAARILVDICRESFEYLDFDVVKRSITDENVCFLTLADKQIAFIPGLIDLLVKVLFTVVTRLKSDYERRDGAQRAWGKSNFDFTTKMEELYSEFYGDWQDQYKLLVLTYYGHEAFNIINVHCRAMAFGPIGIYQMGLEHVQFIALYKVMAKIYAWYGNDDLALKEMCTEHSVYLEHVAIHTGISAEKTGIPNVWYKAVFTQKGADTSVYHQYKEQVPRQKWSDFVLGYSPNFPRVLRFAPDSVWQRAVQPAVMNVARIDAERKEAQQVKFREDAKKRRERQASGNGNNSNQSGRGCGGQGGRAAKRNKNNHGGRGSDASRGPGH